MLRSPELEWCTLSLCSLASTEAPSSTCSSPMSTASWVAKWEPEDYGCSSDAADETPSIDSSVGPARLTSENLAVHQQQCCQAELATPEHNRAITAEPTPIAVRPSLQIRTCLDDASEHADAMFSTTPEALARSITRQRAFSRDALLSPVARTTANPSLATMMRERTETLLFQSVGGNSKPTCISSQRGISPRRINGRQIATARP